MVNSRLKEKVRHLLKAMLTALLFCTQTILDAGWAISVMSVPLLPYVIGFLSGQANPEREIQVLFFSKSVMVGRVIALIGVIVLLLAATQWLWNHAKGGGLIKKGAYSVVRHPQFTGIIIITIGLTVMVLTYPTGSPLQLAGLWLIQILGYIAIARYEEWRLLKRFGENYRQYKRNVPFLFPIKCPYRIPETLFTILIAILIYAFLLFFPYNLIRIL
jgi:protein-S-isoprenylcysteine O-methyltransferase Ste14